MSDITREFIKLMFCEAKLTKNPWDLPSANEMIGIVYQITEVAKSSLVLRSYNNIYGLTKNDSAFESVGAHTNLMAILVDRALNFYYRTEEDLEKEGYTYREIMEAVRLHDLPENMIGDIPDNDSSDTDIKKKNEELYYRVFAQTYMPRDAHFKGKVRLLLNEMDEKSSNIGKLLYCADKTAAILIALQYDDNETPPVLKKNKRQNTRRDLEEMSMCDDKTHNRYHASEMWTIDWFKARKLIDFDIKGFFTCVIIMRTLQVKGRWYDWREKDYQ
ncbi:HD domain-containing protein [Candidatus Saccharibacteria bacterium]|nr:HD domain-containing protein [Candidatus Saccharibacteria bacterium]